jgi:YidC/Oxa1 family membrane protein insertase
MINRNLVTFLLASTVMLFLYSWMMRKSAQEQLEAAQMAQSAQAAQIQQLAAPVAQAQAVPPPASAPAEPEEPVDLLARFRAGNKNLELTWRQHDGALVQAVWKQDGTPFFPMEARDAAGRLTSAEFIGIGGALGAAFRSAPVVEEGPGGKTVTFLDYLGGRLSYRLPDSGCALDVEWASPQGRPGGGLCLVRGLADVPQEIDPLTGRAHPANPFQGLENGRVFAIEDKNVQAVAWGKMLQDPWFKSLGRERKVLPPPAPRVGMDAGFESSKKQMTHYFAAIWDAGPRVPDRAFGMSPGYSLPAGADGGAAARLYLGPKQAEWLSTFHRDGEPEQAKAFQQVMDFGFFGLIAKFMFVLLKYIQRLIPNWGWAIAVFALLLRVVFWSLNTKVTLGMLRQKDLEPHQKKIQAKYAKVSGDRAKSVEMQREIMAFYKKNGHNPMGSCLPMLAQMPIFMALWSMLENVFELRHAPWVLWLKDLSASDPYFILPALMVGTMIAQQAMTPATGDPQQRRMMMVVMPIMMGFFFAYTPAGLTVYYLLYNLVGMGQTWWLMRNYKPRPVVL